MMRRIHAKGSRAVAVLAAMAAAFVALAIPAEPPSVLLQRRPDILQAEQNLVPANFSIGAKRALYYPSISLTGRR